MLFTTTGLIATEIVSLEIIKVILLFLRATVLVSKALFLNNLFEFRKQFSESDRVTFNMLSF